MSQPQTITIRLSIFAVIIACQLLSLICHAINIATSLNR